MQITIRTNNPRDSICALNAEIKLYLDASLLFEMKIEK